MRKSEVYWNFHYLLDLLNNPTKFQHNWIRTQNFQLVGILSQVRNFQLKLFKTGVTLQYGQGR